MGLHHVPGHRIGKAVGQQLEEIAGWLFQLHDQGGWVRGFYSHLVWIGQLALMEGSGTFDRV